MKSLILTTGIENEDILYASFGSEVPPYSILFGIIYIIAQFSDEHPSGDMLSPI